MKRTLLMITLLSLLGVAASNAADRRNFWMLNNTGRTISRFYVAAHGTGESWGNDVFGDGSLSNSLGAMIHFSDNRSRCVYDFRVVYTDGTQHEYNGGRNLCAISGLQFNRNNIDQMQISPHY